MVVGSAKNFAGVRTYGNEDTEDTIRWELQNYSLLLTSDQRRILFFEAETWTTQFLRELKRRM